MTENLNAYKQIRTSSGVYVNVFEPDPDTIHIEDIAHALSNQPRFGGHLPRWYSVAQHCIECFELAEPEDKLCALLHDASEAYLLDMPKPIKVHLSQYEELEDNLMKVIAAKFGFKYPKSQVVSNIDHFMLEREWETIMLKEKSLKNFDPIECMGHQEAKIKFLECFKICK